MPEQLIILSEQQKRVQVASQPSLRMASAQEVPTYSRASGDPFVTGCICLPGNDIPRSGHDGLLASGWSWRVGPRMASPCCPMPSRDNRGICSLPPC